MARGKALEKRGKQGRSRVGGAATTALATDDWPRVAEMLGPLKVPAESLRRFPTIPGSAEEPWDVLLQLLALDEQTALKLLAERTGLAFEPEPRLEEGAARFYESVAGSFARRHQVAGVRSREGCLVVATSQPLKPAVMAELEESLDEPIALVLSPRAAVADLINRGYEQRQDLVTEIIEELPLDEAAIQTAAGSVRESTDLLDLARQTPVIRLVNMILFEALRRRASDIHVHPMEARLVIRFRVDGMLVDAFSPPLALSAAISSRLKVMTELDIANRHSPQDGHTTVRIGNHRIDIRMSCIPTVYGERIVLRLLDQSQTQLSLDEVGMGREIQDRLVSLIERPNGLILVTGPTGSGKTTTLYAALGAVDRASRNVMTIEDPVEYHLEGISQMQVNVKRGVTFASGLRSVLRQDPDVILVGEIRDRETAELAVQASLTGHLVLATLHTNDAPSAIPRLMDIGLQAYLVTSSLLAVLAQRLVRRVCAGCGGPGRTGAGARCETCYGAGYRGRTAVYEIMSMDDELRRLTARNADSITLYEAARRGGFSPMSEDAERKIAAGLTTEAEVRRVLG